MLSSDFHLLEKYPTFGREQLEVPGSHIRRVRSLANYRCLVFRKKKKSESSARNVMKHCRDGGANSLVYNEKGKTLAII